MLSDEAGQTHHQIYILKDYVLPIKNKTHMNNIQPFSVNRTLKTYKGGRFRYTHWSPLLTLQICYEDGPCISVRN